ncbi:UNVERIFIED_CONTAM: hypothetical protein NCL1_14826 [Trichonephila clavipes]
MREANDVVLDRALYLWFSQRRSKGPRYRDGTMELNKKLSGMVDFKASTEEPDHVDDETDEDEDNNNNESSKGPPDADAFSALETAMEWHEQQSVCCPTQLLLFKRIKYLAAKTRRCAMVQRKINGYFPR